MLVLLCSLSSVSGQTTYYLANTGTDSNNGRSADTPFQTLGKINSLTLQPGDQILLRRGDTFRGTLTIRQSGSDNKPIRIDAYGSGNKPVISGALPVTNWTNVGNNIWQASFSTGASRVTGVYRNESALALGRYPNLSAANKGYLTVQSHSGNAQLVSRESTSRDWTGGEAVIRSRQWVLDRAIITSQNGNILNLNNPSGYDLADGWGYFIQNHPNTLDQNGEWYYNASDKTIRIYDDQNNLNGQSITATAYSEGISLTGASYITIQNLVITQTLGTGLLVENGSNLVLANNEITNAGEDALIVRGSGNTILIENNLIENVNNNGLSILPYQNVTVRGNTIRRIGLWAGRGASGDGSYMAVKTLSTVNTLIENNVVDNVGYSGITYSTNTTVRRNRVSNFCLTKNDGGGLYIWNGNKQPLNDIHILSNLVFNGTGAPEGTPNTVFSGAHGIFFDECVTNVEVKDNTVFNCRGLGFFLHAPQNITVIGNTAFNNGEGQFQIAHNHGVCAPRGNTVLNNSFVSRLPDQFVAKYESDANDLTSFGEFDNNSYARPFEDLFKIRIAYNNGSGITGADLSLAEWQNRYGKDRNSVNSPLTFKPFQVSGAEAPMLVSSFDGSSDSWETWSPYGNGQAAWDNGNRIDGGSLRVSFPAGSGKSDSYILVSKNIKAITKGKSYQIAFDAVASSGGKRVEAYLRQRAGSYQDLDVRSIQVTGTNRTHYEALFTAKQDEGTPIVAFQVYEDGQTVWLDNINVREVTLSPVNPDDVIKLVYNETFTDITVSLNGNYRDLRNNLFSNQITLKPFTSAVLLKETTAPAPPAVSLRDPENPASAVSGIDYRYYEGSWGNLPDFTALTPGKTGVAGTPDLSIRNRDNNYGVRFAGYIQIPADGVYTFYVNSDDGSKLYIGSTEVVNNDGGHGPTEKSGTIGLKAGKHALTIPYFQGSGGQTLTVSYSGPGIDKQLIPAAAYYRLPSTPASTGQGTGLMASYYPNKTLSGNPALTRTDATVDVDWGGGAPAAGTGSDNFSVRWSGQVLAPVTGNYTFSTTSDDGIRLWVNGTMVIDNWSDHAPTTNNSASIALTAGQKYDLKLEYFESSGGAVARLMWSYPGQGQQVIPQSQLFPAAPPVSSNGAATYLSDLTWTGMTNGYGPAERDRSNGDAGSADGRPISLNGVGYPKGLGVHAPSEITYNLGGNYTTFVTDMGIDDEVAKGSCGSVEFLVYADNVLLYSSGRITPTTATKSLSVNVAGKQTLKLVVTTAGDDPYCDHADWAGARLLGTGGSRVAAWERAEPTTTPPPTVYPVPVRHLLFVDYYARNTGEVAVELVNVASLPVARVMMPVSAGANTLTLPVQSFARGLYILSVTQDNQRTTHKVILAD